MPPQADTGGPRTAVRDAYSQEDGPPSAWRTVSAEFVSAVRA